MGTLKLNFSLMLTMLSEREREPSAKQVDKGLFTKHNHTMFMKPQGKRGQ